MSWLTFRLAKIAADPKILLMLGVACLTFCLTSNANAQATGDCVRFPFLDDCPGGPNCAYEEPGSSKHGVIHYYVEDDMAADLRACTPQTEDNQLTEQQLRSVIHNAAEVWNTQSRGRALHYRGALAANETTPANTLCSLMTQKPAFFITHRSCFNPDGDNTCSNSNGDTLAAQILRIGTAGIDECEDAFEITIYGKRTGSVGGSCSILGQNQPIRWLLGSDDGPDTVGGVTDRSLLRSLVHEMGHGLGLIHPGGTIVDSDPSNPNTIRSIMLGPNSPHLWEWDKKCVSEEQGFNGGRDTRYFYVERAPNVQNFSSLKLRNEIDVRGMLSGGYVRNTSSDRYGLYQDTAFIHSFAGTNGSLYFGTNEYMPSDIWNLHVAPHIYSPLELDVVTNGSRMNLLQDSTTSPQTAINPPVLQYARSGDNFDSISGPFDYFECETANGTCNTLALLRSNVPMVSAWDPVSGNTVYARVDTEPPSHLGDSGRIFVHPGHWAGTSFANLRPASPLPHQITGPNGNWDYESRTHFAPAIACADFTNANFQHNCILAWHDRGSLNEAILYTFFSVDASDSIDWHNLTYRRNGSIATTTSHVSAAFVDDQIWLSWEDNNEPQRVWAVANNLNSYTDWDDSNAYSLARDYVVDPPTFLYQNDHEWGLVWTESTNYFTY